MAAASPTNLAEEILEQIGVNMFIKTRAPAHQVNTVFLKIRFDQIPEPLYAIIEIIDGRKVITVPSKPEVKKYESYLTKSNWGGGSKICGYDIEPSFLSECYRDCNFTFAFFSKRTRPSLSLRNNASRNSLNLVLCGFIMMTIAMSRQNEPYLYIDNVCSLGGLGKMLMDVAYNMLGITNIDELKLTSLDKPVGFYVHYGFEFDNGTKTYSVPEDSTISYWQYNKSIKNHVTTPRNQLKGRTEFENNAGFIYNNKRGGPMSIVSKGKPVSSIRASVLSKVGGPKGRPSQIVKVKTSDDGIYMKLKLPEAPTNPVIEAVIRGEAEGNQERIESREERRQNIPKTPQRRSRRRYSNSNRNPNTTRKSKRKSKKNSTRKLSL